MKTFAIIRKNTWITRLNHGWGNGYVAIPKEHVLYNKSYNSVLMNCTNLNGLIDVYNIEYNESYKKIRVDDLIFVHGGLTLSESASFLYDDMAKEYPFIFLDDIDGVDLNDYWLFGFDTCHCDDNHHNCTKEYVIKETLDLQEQLEGITFEYLMEKLK